MELPNRTHPVPLSDRKYNIVIYEKGNPGHIRTKNDLHKVLSILRPIVYFLTDQSIGDCVRCCLDLFKVNVVMS